MRRLSFSFIHSRALRVVHWSVGVPVVGDVLLALLDRLRRGGDLDVLLESRSALVRSAGSYARSGPIGPSGAKRFLSSISSIPLVKSLAPLNLRSRGAPTADPLGLGPSWPTTTRHSRARERATLTRCCRRRSRAALRGGGERRPWVGEGKEGEGKEKEAGVGVGARRHVGRVRTEDGETASRPCIASTDSRSPP